MWSRPDFFDAHVHPETLSDADLETWRRLGVSRVLACAHDEALERRLEVEPEAWLRHFDELLNVQARRLFRAGIQTFFALGFHAAHSPWRGFEALLHRLPRYLSHPQVVAIGVVGTRMLNLQERHVLKRQAELAAELRLPLVVQMPASVGRELGEGQSVVRSFLRLLRDLPLAPERILIEGAPPSALPATLALGFRVSLCASGGWISVDEAIKAIAEHGASQFVLSSFAGSGAADLLGVPGMALRMLDAGLSEDVILQVSRRNALRFFGKEHEGRLGAAG